MSRTFEIPMPRGRWLHFYVWGIDDNRSADEYATYTRKMIDCGTRPRRRERMPHGRWYVSVSWNTHPGEAQNGDEESNDRYLGTLAKGWYRVGWSRYRFKHVSFEVALGGEDSMLQAGVHSPILSGAVGARVPRRWLSGWIYEKREWSVSPGYMGSVARVRLAYDWSMNNMGDYYRRQRERGEPTRLTRAQEWAGYERYLGGTHIIGGRLVDWLLGRRAYTDTLVDERAVRFEVPGDQRTYDAKVSIAHEVWARPRWRAMRQTSTEMVVGDPPMFAGKGENSYDCDDDGIFAVRSRTAKTHEAAVHEYVASVLAERKRHGMPAPSQASG